MKLNVTKKIGVEEFPSDVRSWMGKLVNPLNKFFEQAYLALTNGLTIGDNLKGQKFNLDIAANQPYPIKVKWNLNERPTALLLGYIAEDPSGGVIPAHSMQWSIDSGSISVTFSGLDSNTKYKATIIGLV